MYIYRAGSSNLTDLSPYGREDELFVWQDPNPPMFEDRYSIIRSSGHPNKDPRPLSADEPNITCDSTLDHATRNISQSVPQRRSVYCYEPYHLDELNEGLS
jgi:hypothetical protein